MIKVGDFVKGISDRYDITNKKMTKAVVTKVDGEIIAVKVLEHEDESYEMQFFWDLDASCFEVIGHQKEFDREAVLDLLKNGCKKAVLEYNLSDANLSDANLRRANLSDANLRRANLRRANLSDADLSGADLSDADLSDANLSDANLRRANLSDADLSGADLSGADLSGADLSGADLSGANLSGADLDFSCYPLWCGGLHIKTDVRLAKQVAYHLCTMQCDDEEYIKMRNSILDFANGFHRVECGKLTPIEK